MKAKKDKNKSKDKNEEYGVVNQIKRYGIIISYFRKNYATLKEVQSRFAEEGISIDEKMFERDRKAIYLLFKMKITYDGSLRKYKCSSNENQMINTHLLEAFATFSVLGQQKELTSFVIFDTHKTQDNENLHELKKMIEKREQITFIYESFTTDKISERCVDPYALKQFRNRWYLLAKDHKDDTIKSFGLDRISELQKTGLYYSENVVYNPIEAFKHCYGIINDNKPEEVVLSFVPEERNYIRSLPLHHSQEVLIDNKDELRIKLRVGITYDFIKDLLAFGDRVQVLQPQRLIDDIKTHHKNAYKQYK